jgi:hypothetical protein
VKGVWVRRIYISPLLFRVQVDEPRLMPQGAASRAGRPLAIKGK